MFFEAETKQSIKFRKDRVEKRNFLINLLINHYHLDVSFYETDKKFVVEVLSNEYFIVPPVPLS